VLTNANALGDATIPDEQGRRCFYGAWLAGQPAEFISHIQTIEGDMVTEIYHTVGGGAVTVYQDATRDAFGSGTWTSRTCGYLELGEPLGYALEVSACGEEVEVPATEPAASFSLTHPVLTLTPDFGTCDDPVVAEASNFPAGATVAIYGGGRLGHVFAPVADDVVVRENGTFVAEIDVLALVGNCDLDQGGWTNQFRIGASVGSSTSKEDATSAGGDPVGASAVFTHSSSTPTEVRERPRVPSCGTEEQTVEDGNFPTQGPNAEMRQCFLDAVQAGASVEFISITPMREGVNYEYILTVYRSNPEGSVMMYEDRTNDGSGTGGWLAQACTGLQITDDGQFEFASCDEAQAIE
jgi:hypothetical protein